MKTKIFIGSSAEAVHIADAIHSNLSRDAECTVWKHAFNPTQNTLSELMRNLRDTDFGVFVFSPDDLATMRGNANRVARDNVIFELGMFIGRLGAERAFFLVPEKSASMHLPSDLAGVNPLVYESERQDKNWLAALNPACMQIRTTIERLKSFQDAVVDVEAERTPFATKAPRKAVPETPVAIKDGGPITIEPYKKGFLIKGDTKPHKERLKTLANWNRTLGGWVLAASKIEAFRHEFGPLITE